MAAALGVMAFTVFSPAAGVVLEPEPAALTTETDVSTTELVPLEPVAIAPDTTTTTTTETPEAVAPSTTQPAPRIPPAQLTINDIEVSGSVRSVGLEESGAMEVPDVTEIGWYLHGAVPGHPGATVLVAHVWWGDTAGPFHRLGALDPGAPIEVRLENGTLHNYTVVERAIYDKDALPRDLWRNSGPETLVLITCGGTFNNSTQRYDQNIVVYGVPRDTPFEGASDGGNAS